jgi:hypothetical protein
MGFWDCEGVILLDVMQTGMTTESDMYINMLRNEEAV